MHEIFKKFVGKSYEHGGRGPGVYDCWGLVLAIFGDLGVKLWDPEKKYPESRLWAESLFVENLWKEWAPVARPKTFDGVLIMNSRNIPTHAGVMVDDLRFIHAQKKRGVIISALGDQDWKSRIDGFYRLRAFT